MINEENKLKAIIFIELLFPLKPYEFTVFNHTKNNQE